MFNLIAFLLRFSPRIVALAIITGLVAGVSSAGLIMLINTAVHRPGRGGIALVPAFAALGLTVLFSGFTSRALLIQLSQNAIFELRLRLSRQILDAPLLFLEKYGASRLLASLIDDVMVVTGTLLGIPALCINLATVIVCLIYLGWLSWEVLLAVLVFMALGMLSYQTLLKKALRYLQLARQQQNKMFGDFRALTQGTKELKLHLQRREAFLEDHLRTTAADFRRFNITGSRIYAGADSWGQFLFFLVIGLTVFALPVVREAPSQTIVGYTLALLFIMAPLEVLLNFIPNIGRARIALQQIEALGLSLDKAASDSEEGRAQINEPTQWQRLELSGVVHTYLRENKDESFALGPIDMAIEAGETVFLIGGNGSGKTTLVKLITGLYTPEAGEIRVDGEPVTGENREQFRSNFSVVFSDFYLFESLLGLTSIDTDDIAAYYLSKLHLDHKVKVRDGELSTIELSQGQRKRLALLTALMEDRVMYVFDEWAADQDPVFKEVFYTEFLPALKARGKTVLVITHDDKYYHLADRLIKLDSGQIVSQAALPVSEVMPSLLMTHDAGQLAERTREPLSSSLAHDKSLTPPTSSRVGDNGSHDIQVKRRAVPRSSSAPEKSKTKMTLREHLVATWSSGNLARGAAVVVFVAFVVTSSLSVSLSPSPVAENAPLPDFSSARALKHISVIASKPHPMGSLEQSEVRAYIVQELARQGLNPEIRPVSAVDNIRGEFRAGTAQNIVARLPGTENGKAIALVAHYDSAPHAPGASDDGVGVAAILETVRALKTGPPLKNNLIVLFTDGEEELMLGARAFRAEDPLLKEIALVLNFEARGSGGPAIMFETSQNNGWLIRQYAAVAPHPVANSLSGEIYRLLPNNTDLTIFKEAGIGGLNFAHIEGEKNYHTPLDNLENLDERSLQHQGSSALALARHFGNLSLDPSREPNAIYFNTLGTGFVSYPAWVSLPLVVLTALALVGVIITGLRRGAWKVSELVMGVPGLLFSVLLIPALVWGVWWLATQLQAAVGGTPQMSQYKSGFFGVAWIALSAAIFASIYNLVRPWIGTLGLAASGLVVWLVLALVCVAFVPGGSYLFTWPLLFGLAGLLLALVSRNLKRDSWKLVVAACLCALPALLLFVPFINLIQVALGLDSALAVSLLTVLLLLGILPLLYFVSAAGRWVLPVAAAGVAVVSLIVGIWPATADRQHPNTYHLLYALNADTRKAVWASVDARTDEWTGQFLSANPTRGGITDYAPSNFTGFLQHPAEVVDASAPVITSLDDQTVDGVRNLKLRISSSRGAPITYLFAAPDTQILRATLKGKQIDYTGEPLPGQPQFKKLLTYHGIPGEGIEVMLQTKPGVPVKLSVMDQTYGLPAAGNAQRVKPDYLMPLAFTYSNSTLVQKVFVF